MTPDIRARSLAALEGPIRYTTDTDDLDVMDAMVAAPERQERDEFEEQLAYDRRCDKALEQNEVRGWK